jgi:hypothetical protein
MPTLSYLPIALVLLFLGYLAGPLSFDGGLNFGVVTNLLDGQGYSRYYGGYFPFSVESNSLFIFLAVLTHSLFGKSFFASQVPNIIAATLVFLLLFRWVQKNHGPWLALVSCLVLTLTPGFRIFSFGGYGELAAFFFVLLAVLGIDRALERQRSSLFLAAGFCAGAAISIKVISLVALPIVIFAPLLFAQAQLGKGLTRSFITTCGVVLALSAWEAFRFASMGIEKWAYYWDLRIAEIGFRSGFGDRNAAGIEWTEKFYEHLEKLAGFYDLPTLAVGIAASVFILYFATIAAGFLVSLWHPELTRRLTRDRVFVMLGGLACAYLLWWLLLTPTEQAYLRRLYVGLLCAHLVLLHYGLKVTRFGSHKKLRYLAGAGFFCLALVYWTSMLPRVASHSASIKNDTQEILDLMESLPEDAQIYGTGWFHAPQFAYYSGRKFEDLARMPVSDIEFGNAYVVIDVNAINVSIWNVTGPERSRASVLDLFEIEPVYQSARGALLLLKGLKDPSVPSMTEKLPHSIGAEEISRMVQQGNLRGITSERGKHAAASWIDGWLLHEQPSKLTLVGRTYPRHVYSNPLSGESALGRAELRISIRGCKNVTAHIDVASIFEIELPLDCVAQDTQLGRHFEIKTDLISRHTGQFGPRILYQRSYYLERLTIQ